MDGMDVGAVLSDMGSREREKVEVDALDGSGDDSGRGDGCCNSGSCIWPSNVDTFRAWGWLGGKDGVLPYGESETRGDAGNAANVVNTMEWLAVHRDALTHYVIIGTDVLCLIFRQNDILG